MLDRPFTRAVSGQFGILIKLQTQTTYICEVRKASNSLGSSEQSPRKKTRTSHKRKEEDKGHGSC